MISKKNFIMISMGVVSLIFFQGCSLQAPQLIFDLDMLVQNPPDNIIPIAVIGSGPAGLSAALYGARANITTVVFAGDKPGGLLTETTEVENWPGISGQGPAIMKVVEEQAKKFGAQVIYQTVKNVNFSSWPFTMQLTDGSIVRPLTVVIATGAYPRLLDIPGEQEYWGKGVTSCAVCDAPFFKGESVVVVGGGDSAAEEAMQVAQYAKDATLLVRKDAMRASPTMQKLLTGYPNIFIKYNVEVKEISGDGQSVQKVTLFNNLDNTTIELATSGVFLALGHIPNTALVKEVVKTDKAGYIEVSCPSRHTSILGVYAAGDAEDKHYRQAGVASGDGIKAGMDAIEFLTELGYTSQIAQQLSPVLYTATKRRAIEVEHIQNMLDLQRALKSNYAVLVDFYSVTCPPCMQMLPIISTVAAQYEDKGVLFIKVDIDNENDLVKEYNVLKVPTLLVFKNGSLDARINVPLDQSEMEKLVESLIVS